MERYDVQLGDTVPWVSCTSPHTSVVIFDDGHGAWIRRVPLTMDLAVGTRLRYAGVVWQITAYRSHAKAFVAQPIPH